FWPVNCQRSTVNRLLPTVNCQPYGSVELSPLPGDSSVANRIRRYFATRTNLIEGIFHVRFACSCAPRLLPRLRRLRLQHVATAGRTGAVGMVGGAEPVSAPGGPGAESRQDGEGSRRRREGHWGQRHRGPSACDVHPSHPRVERGPAGLSAVAGGAG